MGEFLDSTRRPSNFWSRCHFGSTIVLFFLLLVTWIAVGRHDNHLAERIRILSSALETSQKQLQKTVTQLNELRGGHWNFTHCNHDNSYIFRNFCYHLDTKANCSKLNGSSLAYPADPEELSFLQMLQTSTERSLFMNLTRNDDNLWLSLSGKISNVMWEVGEPLNNNGKCAGFGPRKEGGSFLKMKVLNCSLVSESDRDYVCKLPAELNAETKE